MDWGAIIGHHMLHHLNTVMNVRDNRISIQPRCKRAYDLHILDRVTDTSVMQAAATFTEDYDSTYYLPISYDSSSNAYTTETDEDTTDSSVTDSGEEPALSHTSGNDIQGRSEEQRYEMLDETPTLHPWLDCDSAKEMITQTQTD